MILIEQSLKNKSYTDFSQKVLEVYVLLTAHLGIILVNNQLDVQIFFMYVYFYSLRVSGSCVSITSRINPLNPELNPIGSLLALLGAHHFLHVSNIRVKSLTLRLLMSYIYIYIYIFVCVCVRERETLVA
jgi:predicted neutral ceramidase superfamily lipid hydrolase